MISKEHRFHGHGSLRYVYQHGKTVRGPLIALKSTSNNRRTAYRLAIVVSKKVSKSAVVRNRIRRRLYEAFRLELGNEAPAYDIVVTVFHEQLAEIDSQEVRIMVHAQLLQAGIISKPVKSKA